MACQNHTLFIYIKNKRKHKRIHTHTHTPPYIYKCIDIQQQSIYTTVHHIALCIVVVFFCCNLFCFILLKKILLTNKKNPLRSKLFRIFLLSDCFFYIQNALNCYNWAKKRFIIFIYLFMFIIYAMVSVKICWIYLFVVLFRSTTILSFLTNNMMRFYTERQIFFLIVRLICV